ncbi:MAG: Aminodeoxychorismate lyase [Ignavibacteria bacterium]|nr:Aminodeoxychorismate lyase [Ignavibacteria bacterium]
MRRFLISIAISFLFTIIFIIYVLSIFFSKPEITSPVEIKIPRNSSYSYTVNLCSENNLLRPAWLFKLSAKIYGIISGKKIYPGYYIFSPDNTKIRILKSLFSGKRIYTTIVTFPEGIGLKDFARILAQKVKVDSTEFIRLAQKEEFLARFGISAASAEGYLMPNTYELFYKQNADDVLSMLINEQLKLWKQKFAEKEANSKFSKHEILTLASLIEAETSQPDERKRVAGVFCNRLKRNMKLESDPTVQFALGSKRKLSYKDLDYNNPYNTYQFAGLPPGPINCPGAASIEAAIEPEKNNFLYFVAIPGKSGKHNFASNYNQHLANVAKWRSGR